MKIAIPLALTIAMTSLAHAPDSHSRIRWQSSLDEALRHAAREGKPVLLHQLVGDMDKEGC
jgi:hypothetical protein